MMTTTLEKLTDRAGLVAFGVLYWRDCMSRKDLEWVLKILGEEFACAIAAGEDLEELRAFLAERGVSVPEHVSGSDSSEALPQNRQESGSPREGPAHPYVRRANNQVSPETEALIRELLTQGQTKSAITRALRVNRRVVIRVAREMEEWTADQEHRRVHTGAAQ